MKAGIIAAGEGSRLRAEGITVPKPLVAVGGVPLIERLILSLVRAGITEIACIVNDYSPQVREFVEQRRFPVPIHFVVKTTPSSMHSLFALAPFLLREGDEERFLLSTIDPVFHEEEFLRYAHYAGRKARADGILAVTGFADGDDENPLYVDMDPAGTILRFARSSSGSPVPGSGSGGGDVSAPWVTGGLYAFSPRIFGEMECALGSGIERLRNFLSHLVGRGYRLEGYPFSRIIDIDRTRDIRAAEELLRGGSAIQGGGRAEASH